MNRLSPGFRIFLLGVSLVVLAALGTYAQAQTPCASTIACVSWTNPTTYENNTVIPPEKYQLMICHIWGALQGQPKKDIALVPCVNRTTLLTGLTSGVNCFVVTVELEGTMSANSNETCKMVRPAPPTDGSISAPSDGSIENR